MLQMSYDPEGIIENVGDAVGVVSTRVQGDLERFKNFVEQRGVETGAWRGKIEQPNIQGGRAMKEANEQRSKEPQGTAAGTSSSASSGTSGQSQQRNEASQMAGKPSGGATGQGQGRASQGTQPGEEKMQSQSGMGSGGKQQNAQSGEMSTTHGNGQRNLQSRQRGMVPRNWFGTSDWMDHPFSMMRRFSEEMDHLFDELWAGRGMLQSRQSGRRSQMHWAPQIEMYEKDNQLVICTDLPGLKQDDIQLEVSDDMLTIQGERRNEFEDTQEGYYRSERSYGSFSRTIPLPEGIDPDQAKASFENGVLKVMFPLPQQQQQRKRRIQVEAGSPQQTASGGQGGSSQPSSTPHGA
jgi:HSP20 family protein